MTGTNHCGHEAHVPREPMLAELAVTFPGLFARPLEDFTRSYGEGRNWIQAADGGGASIAGEPIFCSWANGEEPYDGSLHKGFIAWLEQRGWGHENYDGATYVLLPLADF